MDSCKDCRYIYMLTCRRRAPQAMTLDKNERPYQSRNLDYAIAAWPRVHDDDWCGEFERTAAQHSESKEKM